MRCQLQPRLLVMRYGGSGLRAAVHVLFVLASHLLGGTPLVCVARVQLDPLVPLRAATSHLLTRVINPMRAVHETCARRMDVRNVRVLVSQRRPRCSAPVPAHTQSPMPVTPAPETSESAGQVGQAARGTACYHKVTVVVVVPLTTHRRCWCVPRSLQAVLDGVRDGMDAHAAEIARMRAKEKELQARAQVRLGCGLRVCVCSAVTDDVLPLYPPQRVLQALQSGAEKETKAERAFVVEMNSHQRDCAELQGSVETLLRASDRLTMWQESVIDAAAAGDVAAVRRLIKSSARPAPASAASTLNLALRAASRASHSAMVEYLCSLPPQFGVDPRSARADDVARGRFARREVAAVVQELSGQGRDIDMCNGYVDAATCGDGCFGALRVEPLLRSRRSCQAAGTPARVAGHDR